MSLQYVCPLVSLSLRTFVPLVGLSLVRLSLSIFVFRTFVALGGLSLQDVCRCTHLSTINLEHFTNMSISNLDSLSFLSMSLKFSCHPFYIFYLTFLILLYFIIFDFIFLYFHLERYLCIYLSIYLNMYLFIHLARPIEKMIKERSENRQQA